MAIAKNKVLLIIVGVLLLVNLVVLLLFLNMKQQGNRFRDRGRQGMTEILEKKAGFSKQQLQAYQGLREQHLKKIKPLLADMRNARDSFYKLLYRPDVTDSLLSNAADTIAVRQKAIDLQTFRHFQQVRNLCDDSQRPKVDSLIRQLMNRMGPPFRRDNLRERKERQ
jgi:competence protein ComGC